MSVAALTWAFAQDIRPSTAKFVLVALADAANTMALAFPSIESLAAKTSQDRKTVIGALAHLEDLGLLSDTGRRTGHTLSVKVYQLAGLAAEDSAGGFDVAASSPENGIASPANSPENGTASPHPAPRRRAQKPLESALFRSSPENGTAQAVPKTAPLPRQAVPDSGQLAPETVPKTVLHKAEVVPKTVLRTIKTHESESSLEREGHARDDSRCQPFPKLQAHRLPDDWWPDGGARQFAADLGLNSDRIAASFRDYWHGPDARRPAKKDWDATWRIWCRREADRPAGPRVERPFGSRQPASGDGYAAATARVLHRMGMAGQFS